MREIRDSRIIQIDVTNRCENRCSNCTRMLAHHPRRYDMTPEQFERAVVSLDGYPGIVGVFGGNPTLNPHFAEFCRVLCKHVPDKARRGLWCNNLNGHGRLVDATFGYKNLNVHGDADAAAEMRRMCNPLIHGETECWHKPSMVALRDVVEDPARWPEIIDHCPIANRWSAIIGLNPDGVLGCWPCEVMSGWAWANGISDGVRLTEGWWDWPMEDWTDWFRSICPDCGLCLDLPARRDTDCLDDVSETHRERAGVRGVLYTGLVGTAEQGDTLDYTLSRSRGKGRKLQE